MLTLRRCSLVGRRRVAQRPHAVSMAQMARPHSRTIAHAHAASAVAPPARRSFGRTLFGTTAGASFFALAGSLLAWPLADLYLGPELVLWGMRSEPAQTGDLRDSSVATRICEETASAQNPRIVVVSGIPGAGKQMEHIAAHGERSIVYISLREATSAHDLYFAVLAGIYSSDRLGVLGTLMHSMGVWWIILFDILVRCDPEKTRAINFSVILQHLRRALRAAYEDEPLGASRPLVILDHLGDAARHRDEPRVRPMLNHLMAWCAAACFDDGLCDIVICEHPEQTSWAKSSGPTLCNIHSPSAFKDCLRRRWSL